MNKYQFPVLSCIRAAQVLVALSLLFLNSISQSSRSSTMSSESQSEKKMITLKSEDGEAFEVEEAVALQSDTVKHMIELDCVGNTVTLANVRSGDLSKIIEYCKKHAEPGNSEKDIQEWDKKFLEVHPKILYDLFMAANYLDIQSLFGSICQTIADKVKGKSPEEIRAILDIKNDFTRKEEEEIRKENPWAFKGETNKRCLQE